MIDRIFSAALAFCVLAAATLAIGSAMVEQPESIVTMPRVTVIGKRAPAEASPVAVAQNEQAAAQVQ
jgi:hypothetical protein